MLNSGIFLASFQQFFARIHLGLRLWARDSRVEVAHLVHCFARQCVYIFLVLDVSAVAFLLKSTLLPLFRQMRRLAVPQPLRCYPVAWSSFAHRSVSYFLFILKVGSTDHPPRKLETGIPVLLLNLVTYLQRDPTDPRRTLPNRIQTRRSALLRLHPRRHLQP